MRKWSRSEEDFGFSTSVPKIPIIHSIVTEWGQYEGEQGNGTGQTGAGGGQNRVMVQLYREERRQDDGRISAKWWWWWWWGVGQNDDRML